MSHVHKHDISWPLFWSRKVLFVDAVGQGNCGGNEELTTDS